MPSEPCTEPVVITTPGNGPFSALAGVGVARLVERAVDRAAQQRAVAVGERDLLRAGRGCRSSRRAAGCRRSSPGRRCPGVSAGRVGRGGLLEQLGRRSVCGGLVHQRRAGTPGSASWPPGPVIRPYGVVDVLRGRGRRTRATRARGPVPARAGGRGERTDHGGREQTGRRPGGTSHGPNGRLWRGVTWRPAPRTC